MLYFWHNAQAAVHVVMAVAQEEAEEIIILLCSIHMDVVSLPLDKAITMDKGLPFIQILIHRTHRECSKDRIIRVLSINKFSTTQMDQFSVKYVDEEDTADKCWYCCDYSYQAEDDIPQALATITSDEGLDPRVHVYVGASAHMTNDPGNLTN